MDGTILAFAFPAEAGTHLLTPEGWKAELALDALDTLVLWEIEYVETTKNRSTKLC